MTLDVQTVLQAQRAELLLGQFTGEKTPELIAVLIHALLHNRLINAVITIHKRLN